MVFAEAVEQRRRLIISIRDLDANAQGETPEMQNFKVAFAARARHVVRIPA